jgi:hypothetical protein
VHEASRVKLPPFQAASFTVTYPFRL